MHISTINKRRALIAGTALATVVILGGYTAYWFTTAGTIRDRVEAALAQVQQQGAPALAMEHGPVTVGGFPGTFVVRIPQPVITLNTDIPASPGIAGGKWMDRISSDGALVVESSLGGLEYTMRNEGLWHWQSTGNGRTLHAVQSLTTEEAPTLRLHHLPRANAAPEEIFAAFAGFRYAYSQIRMVPADDAGQPLAGAAPLFQAETLRFALSATDIADGKRAMELRVLVRNALYGKDIDTYLSEHPLIRAANGGVPLEMAGQGSLNYECALRYNGTVTQEALHTQGLDFTAQVDNCSGNSNWMQQRVNGTVNFRMPAQARQPGGFSIPTASIKLESDHTITEDYTRQLRRQAMTYAERLAAMVPALQDPTDASVAARKQQVEKALVDVVPHMHTWGVNRIRLDGTVSPGTALTAGNAFDVNLREFSWTHDRYGIGLQGKLAGQGMAASGELRLNLQRYRTMLRDAAGYVNRLLRAVESVQEITNGQPDLATAAGTGPIPMLAGGGGATLGKWQGWRVTQPLLEDSARFLRAVSDEPASSAENVWITIRQQPGNPMPQIGTRTLPEVLQGYQNLLAPHMPR